MISLLVGVTSKINIMPSKNLLLVLLITTIESFDAYLIVVLKVEPL